MEVVYVDSKGWVRPDGATRVEVPELVNYRDTTGHLPVFMCDPQSFEALRTLMVVPKEPGTWRRLNGGADPRTRLPETHIDYVKSQWIVGQRWNDGTVHWYRPEIADPVPIGVC